MRNFILHVFSLLITAASAVAAATTGLEAMLVVVGDQHSAYERTAHFVAHIDRLKNENPGVPFAILINGDSLEYGNVVARRTAGAIDFAMFSALAQRAPTVINLGNHEPEFYDVPETVRRIEATGALVISGNLREPGTGKPYARASTRLTLGAHQVTIVGVTTDLLSTYRVAIRPQLDLAEPVAWAKENFPALWRERGPPARNEPSAGGTPALPIVLSHAGLRADRAMLPLVPEGTLFAGAHDHLRFVHREGRTVYFHSGSWMEFMSIARLRRVDQHLQWEVGQVALQADDPADPALAKLVRETLAKHLPPEETLVVGRLPRALGPTEAALFAVEAARAAAGADVALVGATTFGAGLPAGEVTRFAFDACVRFDGTLWVTEVDGVRMKKMLARTNQGPLTPFAERSGENLVAVAPTEVVPGRTYRFVTTDWVAKNAKTYLGDDPPVLTERPELKLKAAVLFALTK
jgi:5'-nucleotidase / UDP-sugar diphosphatase